MFNHVMLGTNDIDRAEKFYETVLKVIGLETAPIRNTSSSGHQRVFFRHDGNTLAITQPIDGEPATSGNGSTLAFKCASPELVQAFHDTAVQHGAVSIEAPPGARTLGPLSYYLAYVRDPDGHKLCALYRMPLSAAD